MATLDGAGPGDILRPDVLKLRQRFVLKESNGTAIVAKWPRRRGPRKTPQQQAWVDRFSCYAQMFKAPEPWSLDAANMWAKTVSIESASPMKGSGWFFRDVMVRAANNKLITFLGEKRVITPTVLATRLSNQAITNGGFVYVPMTAIRWDNNNFWSLTSNPTRLTFRSAGLYLVGATVQRATGTSGLTQVEIVQNNTLAIARARLPAGTVPQYINVTGVQYFSEGDYVECGVFQTSVTNQYQVENFWALAITPEGLIP